jgi:Kef-type K+ transport system membrane component KefB
VKIVWIYSALLVVGLGLSQILPNILREHTPAAREGVSFLTMAALSFIMIHVGYEFNIDRKLRELGWDYVVAMTAAAFPWIFVTLYFLFVLMPPDAWTSYDGWAGMLLAGRFAAPTSAGILFSMLGAAGLSSTWTFRKARVLAIFDDLDTILLMVPLSMLLVGPAWQMFAAAFVMLVILYAAWRWLNRLVIPFSWPWVLGYATGIALFSELIHRASLLVDPNVPVHIEVLLPAFALGCIMKPLANANSAHIHEAPQEGPESATEQTVSTIISGLFMLLVGLSMPSMFPSAAEGDASEMGLSASVPMPAWPIVVLHVLVITMLCNLGKMFPLGCYRQRASLRERLALSISMWPRGEVGAGVLVIGLSYGLGGPVMTIALLSLALNLVLTGVFILVVKALLRRDQVMGGA